jgi:hypothetical protein
MDKRVSSAKVEPTFVWSDAWVLAAVAVGGGLKGCGLKEVIAAGELINRAILTAGEIRGALGKLVHKGYVDRVDDDLFLIAGEARTAVERLLKQSSASSFGVMQFFEEFLNVNPYSTVRSEASEIECPLPGLTDEQVRAAAQAYREELAALWRELRRIDTGSLPERAVRLLELVNKPR